MGVLNDALMQVIHNIQQSTNAYAYAGDAIHILTYDSAGCRNACSGSCDGSCYGSCDTSCFGGCEGSFGYE